MYGALPYKEIPGEKSKRGSYFREKKHGNEFDFLFFFDSRAVISEDENPNESFAQLICNNLDQTPLSYLMVCRPLSLTVFFSLCNFVYANELRAKALVTNLGFVDFTPKKKENIDDVILQKDFLFKDSNFILQEHGKYRLSNGRYEALFSLDMFPFLESFSEFFLYYFNLVYLVKTHELPNTIRLPRERPEAFYSQLKVTNQFLAELSKLSVTTKIIEPPVWELGVDLPLFDGVHFTQKGHRLFFEYLMNFIV